eukprot:CAMPEP_0117551642 /NCGR_PEP_ID=MMETSP0784-20121206/49295_1 /TAXON_ID=39447 /ORGANISM="" /LENGTH=411 /DNA_ID=CAMNT_0005348685 /DNA_START=54 /DNA_END=1289 /DNA_ORIENTATION=-
MPSRAAGPAARTPAPRTPRGASGGIGSGISVETLQEQVLVARFAKDENPEVHVARVDADNATLQFREANVGADGGISLGRERRVALSHVGTVRVADGVTTVFDRAGTLLFELHLETAEDEQRWSGVLQAVTAAKTSLAGTFPSAIVDTTRSTSSPSGRAESASNTNDIANLQARSQELEQKIGLMEAINKRRDLQLKKMLGRIDGATQMLNAVQDMCGQQKNVIDAQSSAIAELRKDCGLPAEEPKVNTVSVPASSQASPQIATTPAACPQLVADAEAEVQAERMLALLQQADEMQRAFQEMKASTQSPMSPNSMPPPPSPPTRVSSMNVGTSAAVHSPTSVDDAGDDEDGGAAMARLQSLEAEKRHFEEMLRGSQQEHEELLKRLTEMRSLMSALGMQEPDSEAEVDSPE